MLFGLVLALVLVMFVIRKSGEQVGNFLHDMFAGAAPRFAHHLQDKIRSFSVG